MTVTISELAPGFIGEVSGLDITQPLTGAQAAELEAGMDRYGVLVFHDQKFTDEQQKAFSRQLRSAGGDHGGNLTPPGSAAAGNGHGRRVQPGVDHKPLARDDRRRLFNLGNQLWHSDSSFRAIPAKYSLLSGRIVVDPGGNTEFADMRAAYDALDDANEGGDRRSGLRTFADLLTRQLGFTELSDDGRGCSRRCASAWCAPIR